MYSHLRLSLFAAVLVAAIAAVAADPLRAAYPASVSTGKDPVIGTWILNLAKSMYRPGPAPKSQTRTYEEQLGGAETSPVVIAGVKTTIKTVYADGHSTAIQYSANYDSVEYPVTGSPDSDMIALKRTDAYTAAATLTHAGKEIGTARRVISEDGKTMTITYDGMWEGQSAHNVAVFDKQEK